jgi:polyisoprenyl-teichoic acid--peptidoglycan teichoic acid transferase
MPGSRIIAVAVVIVLGLVTASCTGGDERSPDAGPAPTEAGVSVTPQLRMRLVRATGKTEDGTLRPRDITEPAEAIRRDLEELYETAFLAPTLDRPALFSHFSGGARHQAEEDLGRLTIGPVRDELDEVVPRRATVKLTFLGDAGGHPIAAFAETAFLASAVSESLHAPVTNHGDYVLRRSNGAWRIVSYDVQGRTPRPKQMQAQAGRAAFAPGLPSNGPLFVLVIGSDARPGRSAVNARADSIHIVGVNPHLGRVSILGIPRDSWVAIPGSGTNKINAALVRGGPELLVRTVEQVSGIKIDAFVLTGFVGFERLVDAVGGIDVRIPYPIDDSAAGAHFRAGPEHLNRSEALAFARARHDVPAGDFSRSFNQGRLIIAALATLRRQVASGRSAALLPWVLAGSRSLQTDLSLNQIFELLLAAPAFEPSRARNEVASGSGTTIGGLSVVVLGARARALFRDLRRDAVLGG